MPATTRKNLGRKVNLPTLKVGADYLMFSSLAAKKRCMRDPEYDDEDANAVTLTFVSDDIVRYDVYTDDDDENGNQIMEQEEMSRDEFVSLIDPEPLTDEDGLDDDDDCDDCDDDED